MQQTIQAHTSSESAPSLRHIRRRDGSVVDFESSRITRAIAKAAAVTGEFDEATALKLTMRVLALMSASAGASIPTVEQVQDLVEEVLLASPFRKTAKSYVLYRDQHSKLREIRDRASIDLVDGYLGKLD